MVPHWSSVLLNTCALPQGFLDMCLTRARLLTCLLTYLLLQGFLDTCLTGARIAGAHKATQPSLEGFLGLDEYIEQLIVNPMPADAHSTNTNLGPDMGHV